MDNVTKALTFVADHFAGFELSGNSTTSDTYTIEKGSIENMIRGAEVAQNGAKKLLLTIVSRLTGRIRSFKGGEVEDTRISDDSNSIKKLQEQDVAFESFLKKSKEFYKSRFGLEYTRRVFGIPKDSQAQTEAIRGAMELVAKYDKAKAA